MCAFQSKLQVWLHFLLNASASLLLNRVQSLSTGSLFWCQVCIQWNAQIISVNFSMTQASIKYKTVPSLSENSLMCLSGQSHLCIFKAIQAEGLTFQDFLFYKTILMERNYRKWSPNNWISQPFDHCMEKNFMHCLFPVQGTPCA